MPRHFDPTPEDRYIFEEEGDSTEIYFVLSGSWAIAFDMFRIEDETMQPIEYVEGEPTPADVKAKGQVIAIRKSGFSYFGDYYLLASKKCQYHYLALTPCDTFALTKQFLFNEIFPKFPGVHNELVSHSFLRHVREARRPCNKMKQELIAAQNERLRFTEIKPRLLDKNPFKKLRLELSKNSTMMAE